MLADWVRWTIPRDLAAGSYTLVLSTSSDSVHLGTIKVAGVPRVFDAPTVDHIVNANFDNKIALYGYSLKPNNTNLSLEIVWESLDNIDTDYKVFVHLVDRSGQILSQRDAMPQENTYPTSLWLAGEYVVDTYELPMDSNGYGLQVGLYAPDTALRLPLVVGQGQSGDLVPIPF